MYIYLLLLFKDVGVTHSPQVSRELPLLPLSHFYMVTFIFALVRHPTLDVSHSLRPPSSYEIRCSGAVSPAFCTIFRDLSASSFQLIALVTKTDIASQAWCGCPTSPVHISFSHAGTCNFQVLLRGFFYSFLIYSTQENT